jgi:predicted RND superfamily exporter protein
MPWLQSLHRLVLGAFAALAHFGIRHPRRTLLIAAAVTLAAAPGVFRLKLRTDGHALVSENAPEVRYDKAIRDDFGIEDEIVVLIQSGHSNGIFNPDTVQLVRDLTTAFTNLPGIKPSSVVSLATEAGFRLRPGTLIRQTLLEPPLQTKADLDQLRDDLEKIRIYTGTLVSYDGRSTAILIGAPPAGDRTRAYESILQVIAARGPLRDELAVTGAPVAEALLGVHILEDLGVPKGLLGTSTRSRLERVEWKWPASFYEFRLLVARKVGLVPVTVLVMLLVFLATFRNLPATLLPLPEVGVVLLFTFGLMGWFGVPIYLTIAVMPVLLTAMCVTDEIHVFSRYFALLRERPGANHVDLVRETADEMCCPVVNTTLTTAIGFVSFAFSPLAPVQTFGIFTAIGVLLSLLYSLTVVPAMLVLINPQRFGRAWRGTRLMPALARIFRTRTTAPGGSAGFQPAVSPTSRRQTVVSGLTSGGFATRDTAGWKPALRSSGPGPARDGAENSGLGPWFGRLALRTVRCRHWVLAAVFVIVALAPLGLRRLVVQDSWIDGFDPASEFRRATRLVNTQFHGMHLLFVCFESSQTLQGELPSSATGKSRLLLPTNLVENPRELAGASIVLRIGARPGPPSQAETRPLREWKSHIEMISAEGTNLAARLPASDLPAADWRELAQAGTVRYEIAAQTHLRPPTLQMISALADFIRQHRDCTVGGVLSPADYVATSRFMVRPSDPGARFVPNDAGEIKILWDYYRIARGPERLRQTVDARFARSLTTVFLKDGNFIDTTKLMREVRAYEREHLAPRGVKLGFAGDVAVSQSLITGIVNTQLQSLFWSLVGIYLVTALLGRSLRWGVYCVLPSALSVLINFAVMGWAGIPLGVATSMFAGMTLGIGVDFAIHLLEGFGLVRAAGGSAQEALSRSMALTGPPVLVNTLAISLGFGVLMLSQVPANARLGLLVVLGLVDCLLASLLLLPVLLHWWPLKDARAHCSGVNPDLKGPG